MPKQNETKIVPFTKEQMFDLVSNIDSYSEFLPWCNDSKVIKREIKDNEEVVFADLEIGYDQFVYTYRSEVSLAKDKSYINVKNIDGPFKYLINEWKFIDIDKSNSEIQFMIDFELNLSLKILSENQNLFLYCLPLDRSNIFCNLSIQMQIHLG